MVIVGDTIRIHDDAKVHQQLKGMLAIVTEVRKKVGRIGRYSNSRRSLPG